MTCISSSITINSFVRPPFEIHTSKNHFLSTEKTFNPIILNFNHHIDHVCMCDLTRKTTQKIGHSTCTEIILNILTKKEKKKLINFWNKDSKKPKIPLKDPNGPPLKCLLKRTSHCRNLVLSSLRHLTTCIREKKKKKNFSDGPLISLFSSWSLFLLNPNPNP